MTTILAASALGITGTKIIDINLTQIISKLRFRFAVTTGNAQMISTPLDAISKIEILDGSNKLLELTGTALDAVQFFDTGKVGTSGVHNGKSAAHIETASVLFGRFPNDPLYAFDPKKFTNPQIRVTWNAATCEVNATDLTLTVIADVFDQKEVTPVGFMRNNTVYVYTPVAGAFAYVDLPVDLDIRKLIVQMHLLGVDFRTLLGEVKLSENNDQRVPFDMSGDEFIELDHSLYPKIVQQVDFFTSAGGHWVFAAPSSNAMQMVGNVAGVRTHQTTNFYGNRFSCGTANATDWLRGFLQGDLPWQSVCYPFGVPDDPADWYKPQDIGSLRLRIKAGGSVGAVTVGSVILQQIFKYA